jgi:carbonic anhydrase
MHKLIVAALFLLSLSASAQSTLWQALTDGNTAYVKGEVDVPRVPATRMTWAASQAPPFSILSCADSRVPAEMIFMRTVGEMFVVRVAGNTPDEFDYASLEYAIVNNWTRMIVVMAHSDCGAVKAAMGKDDSKLTPALKALVERIRLSGIPRDDHPTAEELRKAAVMNAQYSRRLLLKNDVVAKAVKDGQLTVVVAIYDVASGKVEQVATE